MLYFDLNVYKPQKEYFNMAKRNLTVWSILIVVIIIIVASLLIVSSIFNPAPTEYAWFVEACENTGGVVAPPTVICPWYDPNCNERFTICDCGNSAFAFKDIIDHLWDGCPTV